MINVRKKKEKYYFLNYLHSKKLYNLNIKCIINNLSHILVYTIEILLFYKKNYFNFIYIILENYLTNGKAKIY